MLLEFVRRWMSSPPRLDPTRQRRNSVRVPCDLPVECLLSPQVVTAHAIDISEEGLRLELPCRVMVGSFVDIRYVGPLHGQYVRRVVRCRVVWIHSLGDDYHAGLAFVDSVFALAASWVQIMLRRLFRAVRMSDDRRQIRIPTNLQASIEFDRLHGVHRIDGRLLDLSVGGALFEGPTPPLVGRRAILRLATPRVLELEAQVVRAPRAGEWPPRCGLRFTTPSAEAVRALLEVVAQLATQWRLTAPRAAGHARTAVLA